MKKSYLLLILVLLACGTKKKLETKAPFTLGATYLQPLITDRSLNEMSYELVIPIVNLDTQVATLQNIYYHGKRFPLTIELREIGHVAIAEVDISGVSPSASEEAFPFELSDTQAVLSYLEKDKVRYVLINGIRQNVSPNMATTTTKIGD